MGSSELKGSMPAIISKMKMPRVHQSKITSPCRVVTCGFPMPLVQQNFGGDVVRRAESGLGFPSAANFGEAEVAQFEVPVRFDQKVLGLQVPVNDVLGMQILEHKNYLSSVENAFLILQNYLVPHVGK